jgi:hypothetical protein
MSLSASRHCDRGLFGNKVTGKVFKAPFCSRLKAEFGFQQFTDTAVVQRAMR